MKPVEFPEHNTVLAKDQPEYLPLPCWQSEHETISCWRLSFQERLKILFGAPLWLSQLNFGQPLQPQKPSLEYPFEATP